MKDQIRNIGTIMNAEDMPILPNKVLHASQAVRSAHDSQKLYRSFASMPGGMTLLESADSLAENIQKETASTGDPRAVVAGVQGAEDISAEMLLTEKVIQLVKSFYTEPANLRAMMTGKAEGKQLAAVPASIDACMRSAILQHCTFAMTDFLDTCVRCLDIHEALPLAAVWSMRFLTALIADNDTLKPISQNRLVGFARMLKHTCEV